MKSALLRTLISAATAFSIAACSTVPPVAPTPNAPETFRPLQKRQINDFLDDEALAALEGPENAEHLIGAGDHLKLDVWERPELSGKHVVGPDGRIGLPLVGAMPLDTLTSDEASERITTAFTRFYRRPTVQLTIEKYTSNRVTVLGRVQNPGSLSFDNQPTLLEALARAGALPVIDKQATLTRCAIFRGRDKVIWIDLKRLLARNSTAYNLRLKPNDLIYIPDSFDTLVYVLGAVQKPGAYRLTPDMSLLDALAQAGGPNDDAAPDEITLYRPAADAAERASLAALLTNRPKRNFSLEEGDVVFIPKSGIAEAGYVMRQLLPGLSFMTFGVNAATR